MTAAANGRRAFDLDQAVKAAYAENAPAPFPFTYKGKSYSVPPAQSWPMEAQSLIGQGEIERAMGMILSPDTYRALVEAGMTMGELTVLLEAVGQEAGVGGLPNSSPPAALGASRT